LVRRNTIAGFRPKAMAFGETEKELGLDRRRWPLVRRKTRGGFGPKAIAVGKSEHEGWVQTEGDGRW
jgi:hypothetical protein